MRGIAKDYRLAAWPNQLNANGSLCKPGSWGAVESATVTPLGNGTLQATGSTVNSYIQHGGYPASGTFLFGMVPGGQYMFRGGGPTMLHRVAYKGSDGGWYTVEHTGPGIITIPKTALAIGGFRFVIGIGTVTIAQPGIFPKSAPASWWQPGK